MSERGTLIWQNCLGGRQDKKGWKHWPNLFWKCGVTELQLAVLQFGLLLKNIKPHYSSYISIYIFCPGSLIEEPSRSLPNSPAKRVSPAKKKQFFINQAIRNSDLIPRAKGKKSLRRQENSKLACVQYMYVSNHLEWHACGRFRSRLYTAGIGKWTCDIHPISPINMSMRGFGPSNLLLHIHTTKICASMHNT